MAWSENTRQQYPHGETRYASDYLDAEWVGFEPLFRGPRIAQRLRLARPGLAESGPVEALPQRNFDRKQALWAAGRRLLVRDWNVISAFCGF